MGNNFYPKGSVIKIKHYTRTIKNIRKAYEKMKKGEYISVIDAINLKLILNMCQEKFPNFKYHE